MVIADAAGFPVAICFASASPHEVKLAEAALDSLFICGMLDKLVVDKAYRSNTLNKNLLRKHDIELIAPHRRSRKKTKTEVAQTSLESRRCAIC